jgi:hypothetical protein
MTNEELEHEIRRADRNAEKTASLAAVNERASRSVAAALGHAPDAPPPPPPRPAYAVRG